MSLRASRSFAVALVAVATFTDIVAYSVAVPVLPDLSRRLGASPTMIGLLFASFGVTLLTVSMPMGTVSDRIGRKAPLVGGLIALAVATWLFAFARGLPWLFAARLVQGAADAVTWVVGLALIADRYGPDERGRVVGMVMSATSVGFMIGPSLGGWLYEIGGIRLPFLAVGALALVAATAFIWIEVPKERAAPERVPVAALLRVPAFASCAVAVVAVSATGSMLEPVLPLFFATRLGLGPARIGLVFGIGAVVSAVLHPIVGRLADRWGARRLTMIGLGLVAPALLLLSRAWSYPSAIVLFVLQTATVASVITPSLAYMAEATSHAGVGSFGVAYGLYNVAWGVGLLGGPALGGFLYEQMGFAKLALVWSPLVVIVTVVLTRANPKVRLKPDTTTVSTTTFST